MNRAGRISGPVDQGEGVAGMAEPTAQGARDPRVGVPRTADVGRLLRCAAVFLPGPVPREGRIAFWDPHAEPGAPARDGSSSFAYADSAYVGSTYANGAYANGAHADDRAPADAVPYSASLLTVVRRDAAAATGLRTAEVPAALLSVVDALPVLVRARHQAPPTPPPAAGARPPCTPCTSPRAGRLLPGLTADGHDAWRAGPLDADDIAHLRAVAAAMPLRGARGAAARRRARSGCPTRRR